MAHLFTQVHRKKHLRDPLHELYHGGYCEDQYMQGLYLSDKAKTLRKAIKFKRNSIETLRKLERRYSSKEIFWQEVNTWRNDPRSIAELKKLLADVEQKLRTVKQNYKYGFMVSRNFDYLRIQHELAWELHRAGKVSHNVARQAILLINMVQDHNRKTEENYRYHLANGNLMKYPGSLTE